MNSPGQNTGVGSLSLLLGVFPTQGLNLGLPQGRFFTIAATGKPRFSQETRSDSAWVKRACWTMSGSGSRRGRQADVMGAGKSSSQPHTLASALSSPGHACFIPLPDRVFARPHCHHGARCGLGAAVVPGVGGSDSVWPLRQSPRPRTPVLLPGKSYGWRSLVGCSPSPGDLPNPGIKPRSPALQADSLPSEPLGKPIISKVTATHSG